MMKELDKMWVGLVEDNIDPDRLGRIKVRVQSVFDDIPVEDIPWAHPVKSLSSRSYEMPAIGKIVTVIFPNENLYKPYYMYSSVYNVNLSKKLLDLSDEEYTNFVALLFDHKTKIYSDDEELTLDYLYNKITIDNNNINIELKDNQRRVNIGTKTASQQAVLGNHWFEWFDKFIDQLVKPDSLIGNMSAPILKPKLDLLLVEYKTLRETFLSDHVYLVDDMKVDKLKMEYNSPIMDDGIKINSKPVVGAITNEAGIPDTNVTNLSDKIKEQKTKELEVLKNSIPSTVSKDENVMEVIVDPTIPDESINSYTEIYKEKKNSNEVIIPKPVYEQTKETELKESGLDVYEYVDDQSDANDLFLEQSIIEAENNQDTEELNSSEVEVLKTQSGDSYVDTSFQNQSKRFSIPSGKNVSLHITYKQSFYSDTAKKKKIDNSPTEEHLSNMKLLANNIYEPLWDYFGYDLNINSMYRSSNLNTAVGGSSTSQHSKGQAFDLGDPKGNNKKLFAAVLKLDLPFDQLIWEFGNDNQPAWVHISHKPSGTQRKQILKAKKSGGSVSYPSMGDVSAVKNNYSKFA